MNETTVKVIKDRMKTSCSELQELMQDYMAHSDEYGYRYALLMLALDEINGNEDPTCTYLELFAEECPDHDLDMVNKEAVLHNRKVMEKYTEFNNKQGWQ